MKHKLAVLLTMFSAWTGWMWVVPCYAVDPEEASDPSRAPLVYTSFYPTKYFAERIAGEAVRVVCPVPAGDDPAFWMPDAKMVQAFQKADLIITNGASFEKWVGKVTIPESRVVNTASPLKGSFIEFEEEITHSHGPGGKHTHKGIDGHTWLDPVNAKIQAEEVLKALSKRFPGQASSFDENFHALAKDLEKLDARLKAVSVGIGDRILLCSHPAYNYLARRYGWRVKNFHLDPDTMPEKATLAKVKETTEHHPVCCMLWEGPPAEEIVAKMQALGVKCVVFSPCETLNPEEIAQGTDFVSVMNGNLDRLQRASR